MSMDKSAQERGDLNRRIERVEQDEDEFAQRSRSYENSLEQFREQFHAVGRERDSRLGERLHSADSAAQRELEERQEFRYQLNRYVDGALEVIEEMSPQIRQSFADERERLIAERNGLPWE